MSGRLLRSPTHAHGVESVPGLRQDPIELARRNWVDAGWADVADGMAMVTSIMRVQQLSLEQIEVLLKCSRGWTCPEQIQMQSSPACTSCVGPAATYPDHSSRHGSPRVGQHVVARHCRKRSDSC